MLKVIYACCPPLFSFSCCCLSLPVWEGPQHEQEGGSVLIFHAVLEKLTGESCSIRDEDAISSTQFFRPLSLHTRLLSARPQKRKWSSENRERGGGNGWNSPAPASGQSFKRHAITQVGRPTAAAGLPNKVVALRRPSRTRELLLPNWPGIESG